jgi:hypothetical protein
MPFAGRIGLLGCSSNLTDLKTVPRIKVKTDVKYRLSGSGFRVQGSGLKKTRQARIKGSVSSSGYKSVSLNGV